MYLQLARFGELAQLARAPALQAGGHRFDSDILHLIVVIVEMPLCRSLTY